MNILFDIFLLGIMSLFGDSEQKRQRKAFKNRREIAEAKKRMDAETGMAYIILDDLGRPVQERQDFQYQEPPTESFHCDDGGPDW